MSQRVGIIPGITMRKTYTHTSADMA